MYIIEVDARTNQIITIFHRLGMWRNETNFRHVAWKFFNIIFSVSFVISLVSGGFLNDDKEMSSFLFSLAITATVTTFKITHILWKNKEISSFLRNIVSHSIEDYEEYVQVNRKLNNFMKFRVFFISMLSIAVILFIVLILPIFSNEKKLLIDIGFPLDWRNSEFVYWLANAYVFLCCLFSVVSYLFTIIIWYLMLNCSIKLQILGSQFRNMGTIRTTNTTAVKKWKISEAEQQTLFLQDSIKLIKIHQSQRQYITVSK